MAIRMSHEISHYWFGLLLGAKDWTEEWLSEGFATYMEDSIHAKVLQVMPRKINHQFLKCIFSSVFSRKSYISIPYQYVGLLRNVQDPTLVMVNHLLYLCLTSDHAKTN